MATYQRRLAGLIAALLALTVMLAISVVWALGKWPSPTRSSTSPIAAGGSSQLPLCIQPEPPPVKLAEPCPAVPAAQPVAAAAAASTPPHPSALSAAPEKPEKPEKPLRPLRPGAKVAGVKHPAGEETASGSPAEQPAPIVAAPPAAPKAPDKSKNPIDLDPYK